MDSNKLAKLQEVGYRIRGSCRSCRHRREGARTCYTGFGTCRKHTYQHQKHTDSTREMSIWMDGYCDDYEWDCSYPQGFEKFMRHDQ